MKKIIVTIIFVLVLAITGCSCVPEVSLTFKNNWNGGNEPTDNLTQTTTYSVALDKDFKFESYNYAKSASLADDLYQFENGVYTQTLKVIQKGDITLSELSGNDILADNLSYVLKLTTEFKIDAYYTYGDKTREHYEDSIVTEAYFGTVAASFTPIYSKTTATYSQLFFGETAKVEKVSTSTTSIFSKNSYLITTKIGDNDATTQKIDKSYKQYIDNNQLLFVVRNIDIAKSEDSQTSFSLPTVASLYGDPQTLSVTYFADSTERMGELEIPVRCLSYDLSSTNNSGRSQLVFVQNKAVDGFNGGAHNAIMMKYVEPLMTYGTFESMGALVYTLTSVS